MSASPLSVEIDNLRRMEDAGAAAVVLHSLFEEQIALESLDLDRHPGSGSEPFPEALTYFPDMTGYNLGPEGYLEHIPRPKAAVGIPVIASLNGTSSVGWIRYARMMQEGGADALELSIDDIPTDSELSAAQVEQRYVDLVRDVTAAVTMPVAVKLGHAFSAFAHVARRLDQAGARALVLFNRFYQPDFDLENLEVVSHVQLSHPYEVQPRIHWVADLVWPDPGRFGGHGWPPHR